MKAVIYSLMAMVLVLTTGCGSNSSSKKSNEDSTRRKPDSSFTAFVGTWRVESLDCNDEATDFSHIDFIKIPDSNFLVVVNISEDTETHLCKEVTGYHFAASGWNNGLVASSLPGYSQSGTLWAAVVRDVCWKRSAGKTEKEPYLDETIQVQGPHFEGHYEQRSQENMVFYSPNSPICDNQRTLLLLKKK